MGVDNNLYIYYIECRFYTPFNDDTGPALIVLLAFNSLIHDCVCNNRGVLNLPENNADIRSVRARVHVLVSPRDTSKDIYGVNFLFSFTRDAWLGMT